MNIKVILASFLTLSLLPLSTWAIGRNDCKPYNLDKPFYQYRTSDKRCEGTQAGKRSDNVKISLSVGQLQPPPRNQKNLAVRIPSQDFRNLKLEVYSRDEEYHLNPENPLRFESDPEFPTLGKLTRFQWSKEVIETAKVEYSTLWASAIVPKNPNEIYYPVILGKSSGYYDFVFDFQKPVAVKLESFNIYPQGNRNPIYKYKASSGQNWNYSGLAKQQWKGLKSNGDSASKGLYRLEVSIQREATPRRPWKRSIYFWHNPEWLN